MGADFVQMIALGLPSSRSSSEPTRRMMRWGRASASLNSGEPQLAQNERRIVAPLSAVELEDAGLADNADRILIEDRIRHAGAAT